MAAPQQLTFRAGGAQVAIAASTVAEIAPAPKLTRAPRAPDQLLGVAQWRGVVIPVVATATLAGSKGAVQSPARMIVLRWDPPLALAADAIETLGAALDDQSVLSEDEIRISDAGESRTVDLHAVLAEAFPRLEAKRARREAAPEAAPAGSPRLAYLALTIAGQAYAFPLADVLEVGARPTGHQPLPHTEAVLLGLQTWRGRPIPLVSMRALLGLPSNGDEDGAQVVVRLANQPIALAVDAVTEIVRVEPDRLGPAPDLFNLGAGEAQVRLVLRRTDGPGLVAVLTPEDLLADHRLRRWSSTEAAAAAPVAGHVRRKEPHLLIRIGAETYGLPLAAVREIASFPAKLSRVPGAPPDLLGVMNLRGRPMPVLDAARRFGAERGVGRRVVVLAARGEQAAFAVDADMTIVDIDAASLFGAPQLDDQPAQAFPHAVRIGEELVLLADPEILLDEARADLAADLRRRRARG